MSIYWGLKCSERLFKRKKVDTTIKGRKRKRMYIYQCLKDTTCIMLPTSNSTAHNKHVFYSIKITISLGILWYQSNIRTVYHDPFRYADETGVGTA